MHEHIKWLFTWKFHTPFISFLISEKCPPLHLYAFSHIYNRVQLGDGGNCSSICFRKKMGNEFLYGMNYLIMSDGCYLLSIRLNSLLILVACWTNPLTHYVVILNKNALRFIMAAILFANPFSQFFCFSYEVKFLLKVYETESYKRTKVNTWKSTCK